MSDDVSVFKLLCEDVFFDVRLIEPTVVGELDGEVDPCCVKIPLLLVAADRSIEKSIRRGKNANLRYLKAELSLRSMYRDCTDLTYFTILSKWCHEREGMMKNNMRCLVDELL